MKKFLHLSVIVMSVLFQYGIAEAQGPISPTEGFVGKTEIAIIWENSGYSNGNDITFNHNIFKLKDDYEIISDPSQRFETNDSSHLMDNLGNSIINAASGDFNGDTKDEYILVSHGENNTINFAIPGIKELKIDSFHLDHFSEGPESELNRSFKGNILVEAGDLNASGKDEIIIAYVDTTDQIRIRIFGLSHSGNLTNLRDIEDEILSRRENSDMYAIHVDDIDDNGTKEILMAFYSDDPQPGIYLNVYSFENTDFSNFKKTKQIIDANHAPALIDKNITLSVDITSGDFDGDSIKEVASGFSTIHEPADLYIFPAEVKDDPSTSEVDPLELIEFKQENLVHIEFNWNGQVLNLVSGDTNNNGREEIFATGTNNHLIYSPEEGSLQFSAKSSGYIFGNFIKYVDIRNIDNQPENGKEILLLQDISSDFVLTGFSVDNDFNTTVLARYSFNTWGKNPGSGVLVAGDYDGDIFRIGPGKKYNKTDIVQPLVILNAPPTHFDMIEGEIYDVNECHNGNNCESYANYTTTTSEEISVSTTLRESWGVSSTLSGGGKVLGIGVEAYLTGTYGKNFEKTTGSSETVTIQQSVTATFDDQIYATVCDYEMWEYIVYDKNNQPAGNILTMKPMLTENRWFPSKERSASGYIPKHEVGNILSYTPYKDLLNPDGEEKIRGSYGSGSYDLDANTDVTFRVNLSNTFNNTVVEERQIGVEVGGSISKWGIELSGSASYNRSDLSTHSVSVGEALDITVHLGGINRSIGETGYNVTPYIYWGTNGALVIDYAARPILPEPGGTDTWWSETYHTADPAFILPWRLDPEKGLILQDEAKRERTKSITFSPAEPEEGDTVTLTAVINNFSPYPTADVIPVSFYIGHPLNGGTLISDLNGNSLFFTGKLLEAQNHQKVSFKWVVPENLTSFPRIYGYIDPMNMLNEIHNDNNIGWVILGKSDEGGPTGTGDGFAEKNDTNIDAFPNPFTNQATLEFKLNETSDVMIRVYDIRGKLVFNRLNPSMAPGRHQQVINGERLKPGMYIYQIRSNEYNESGRILKSF